MRILFLLFALTATAIAQPNTCGGLTSVTDTTPPVYPPIARAAHIADTLILMAEFKPTGEVGNIAVLSGAPMLRASAVAYVQGWRANPYGGPRTCPIVVQFAFTEGTCDEPLPGAKEVHIHRSDSQHVTLTTQPTIICDPAAEIQKRKHRFLFF